MLPKGSKWIVDLFKQFFSFSITVFHSDLGKDIELISNVLDTKDRKNKQYVSINEENYSCGPLRSVVTKFTVLRKFKKLGLIPIPFSQLIGRVGRGNRLGGWHFGGTLAMQKKPVKATNCLANGELKSMKRLFIIDSSGFPSIPGSSVALLTMANSYRIARRSL